MNVRSRRRHTETVGYDVGCLADGSPLVVPAGVSVLAAGSPGAGKSTFLRCVATRAAARRDTALVVVDGKRTELAYLRPRASAVALDRRQAAGLLTGLVVELERRFTVLEALGLNDYTPALGPRIVVLVDELAVVLGGPDRKLSDRIYADLLTVVTIGRAAGCAAIMATQHPAAELVGASLRAVIPAKIAFHVAAPGSVAEMLAIDADLSTIPFGAPGRCIVQFDHGAQPARIADLTLDRARHLIAGYAHLRPTLDLEVHTAMSDTHSSSTRPVARAAHTDPATIATGPHTPPPAHTGAVPPTSPTTPATACPWPPPHLPPGLPQPAPTPPTVTTAPAVTPEDNRPNGRASAGAAGTIPPVTPTPDPSPVLARLAAPALTELHHLVLSHLTNTPTPHRTIWQTITRTHTLSRTTTLRILHDLTHAHLAIETTPDRWQRS